MHHCLFKVKIESDPEFLGVTISHCHSLPVLWQIILSILKTVMFDQKKKEFSVFFCCWVFKSFVQWRQTKQIILPPLCSIMWGSFFSSNFFLADLFLVFLCNCYQNVCQAHPWFINLIIILPRERKTLIVITWLNEILEYPFTAKCIFLL